MSGVASGPGLEAGAAEEADLLWALTEDDLVVDVSRGENAKRTLQHSGVVRTLVARKRQSGSAAPMTMVTRAALNGNVRTCGWSCSSSRRRASASSASARRSFDQHRRIRNIDRASPGMRHDLIEHVPRRAEPRSSGRFGGRPASHDFLDPAVEEEDVARAEPPAAPAAAVVPDRPRGGPSCRSTSAVAMPRWMPAGVQRAKSRHSTTTSWAKRTTRQSPFGSVEYCHHCSSGAPATQRRQSSSCRVRSPRTDALRTARIFRVRAEHNLDEP